MGEKPRALPTLTQRLLLRKRPWPVQQATVALAPNPETGKLAAAPTVKTATLVRSKFCYECIPTYATPPHSPVIWPSIQRGLRICIGGFRSSPVLPLYAGSGEPPLQLRCDYMNLIYYRLRWTLNASYRTVLDPRADEWYQLASPCYLLGQILLASGRKEELTWKSSSLKIDWSLRIICHINTLVITGVTSNIRLISLLYRILA